MISDKASTILGTIATVCWCIQLIPQIIYNYKRKDCTGLPPIMMFLWVISGIPFGIYFCISAPNIILQIQPHLFMIFCAVSFAQTLYYPPCQMNRLKIAAIMLTTTLVDIGLEVGFIIWLKPLYQKGTKWPDLIFGITASVLLAVGLLPPYFELIKRKGRVVGINFLFLFVDSLGAWLSIVSVVVGTMDIMGIVLYCIVAGMELGIFASHFIWCCRFKWLGKNQEANNEPTVVEHYEKEDEDVLTNLNSKIEVAKNGSNCSFKSNTRELHRAVVDHDTDNEIADDSEEVRMYSTSVQTIHGVTMQNGSINTGSIRI